MKKIQIIVQGVFYPFWRVKYIEETQNKEVFKDEKIFYAFTISKALEKGDKIAEKIKNRG